MLWKKVLVVRPQPGQDVTWGEKCRRSSDWRTLLRHAHLLAAIAVGFRRERYPDRVADSLLQQERESGSAGDDPLHAHAGLGEAKMQWVVAPNGEEVIDVDEILHIGHLRADHDAIMRQPDRLGERGRAQRRLDHRVEHHVARRSRYRRLRIGIHHAGEQRLIE